MSKRSRYSALDLMKVKASMSEKVVSTKDPDFALYAGASWAISSRIANIDFMLRHGLFPDKRLAIMAKLYRAYLNQQRKAFFASVCSEVSKLGFILGMRDDTLSF